MITKSLHVALLVTFFAVLVSEAASSLLFAPPETCNLHLWIDPETHDLEWRCHGACDLADGQEFPMHSCSDQFYDVTEEGNRYVCDCAGSTIEFPAACKASFIMINGTLVWSAPHAGCIDECGGAGGTCTSVLATGVPAAPQHTTACSNCNGAW